RAQTPAARATAAAAASCVLARLLDPLSGLDDFLATHIETQRFGNDHASVGLLAVFQYSNQAAPHRQAGTVQCMDVFRLCFWPCRTEARLHAPGLEGFAVGYRRDLAPGVLRGQPHFQV